MDAVLVALCDLLVLPQAVAAIHDTAVCDQIIDRFLVLADAYGTFQSTLITLKQSVAELQVAKEFDTGVSVCVYSTLRRSAVVLFG